VSNPNSTTNHAKMNFSKAIEKHDGFLILLGCLGRFLPKPVGFLHGLIV